MHCTFLNKVHCLILNIATNKYCHTCPCFLQLIGGEHATQRAVALRWSPIMCPVGRKCGETGRLGTRFEESLDQWGNSLCGMWHTCSRLLSNPGHLNVFSIFLPNGEYVATQTNSRLVPMLLTECGLSCVFEIGYL